MKITLVRHGQTIENASRITMGQLDGTLSELGLKQAKEAATKLKDREFDYIYSSDLGRCKQTASEIIKFHKNTSVFYVKELREMHFGDFEGKYALADKWDELPGSFETRRAPNGENGVELQKRIVNFVNSLFKKHPKANVLLVAHGGVMKSLKANIENLDYETTIRSACENCEIWEYDIVTPIKLNKQNETVKIT